MKTTLLAIFCLLFATASQAADSPPETPFVFTGTVKYIDLLGGSYVIAGDDGKTYEPVRWKPEFRKEGLRVRVNAQREKEMATILRAGEIIRVLEIEKLSQGSGG